MSSLGVSKSPRSSMANRRLFLVVLRSWGRSVFFFCHPVRILAQMRCGNTKMSRISHEKSLSNFQDLLRCAWRTR